MITKLTLLFVLLTTVLGCSVQTPLPFEPGQSTANVLQQFEYDRTAPLELTTSPLAIPGFNVLDISYASPLGGRVPGFLFLPDGKGPFPALILMHGLPSDRHAITGHAERYVRTGAVVLIISAPHGRPDGVVRQAINFTLQDSVEQVQLIVDLRRGIDLLTAHELVDSTRIGYVGGSYGGAIGGLLAGVEDRIKAYVFVVGDGGVVTHFRTGGDLERLSPKVRERWLRAMEPIEPINFVGMAAPAPLLFQNGRFDQFVSVHDAEKYQNAGSEPKTIRWYDAGHGLPEEAFVFQAEWLEKQLGIDASRYVW